LLKKWIIILLLILTCGNLSAQIDSLYNKGINLPTKLIGSLNGQYERLSKRINKQTSHYLKKLEKKETQLKTALAQKDSLKAAQVFGNVKDKYAKLQQQLQNKAGKLQGLNSYIPGLDSINTASKYLSQLKNINPVQLTQLTVLNQTTGNLQQQLQSAINIQQIFKDRQQQLEQTLSQYNITKQLQSFNKQAYYYQQQITEYKNLLHDETKLQQKALGLVRELPAFKDFMSRNGQLAQLFRLPDNYGTPQALAGLQTRAGIDQLIQQRLGVGGGTGANTGNTGTGTANNMLQQQIQQAQGQLSQLKDKLNGLGSNTNQDIQMPQGFKPNSQKTKSFLQRIEYGINIQSQKNGLLPTTSDIAGTIGYKLNDKSIIGIGAGYKLGWGNSINNIILSNEGIGLRSFIDIKLPSFGGAGEGFWITGGYEQNYMKGFDKIPQLNDYSKWQQSGLIGVSKKYSIGKKKGNLQLLYDLLHKQHIPTTQPILFRIGYTF
jgi:hypothetical protein